MTWLIDDCMCNIRKRNIQTEFIVLKIYHLIPQYCQIICIVQYKPTNEPSHDKTNKMACAQRRLRSAWACAQSDQSLPYPHEESLCP